MKNKQYKLYYDFSIGEQNAGYYTINSRPGVITMLAKFMLDGEIYENFFELKHDGDRVTAYRSGEGGWQSMEEFGEDHYPTSAYPLLLGKVKDRYVYQSIDEGSGEVQGETVLVRSGKRIIEKRRHITRRVFWMDGNIPIKIDWGGPVSMLQETPERARMGSPFEVEEI